jgi:hypothetical protein
MRRLLLALLLLLLPSLASASYTTATSVSDAQVMSDGTLLVIVQFSGDSGEAIVARTFSAKSFADLQVQVQAALAQLNQSKSDFVKIPKGTVIAAPTKAADPVVTPPSAEQQFFADLNRFLGVQRAVDVGIVSASDPTYLALKDNLTKAFVSAWVNDNGWSR